MRIGSWEIGKRTPHHNEQQVPYMWQSSMFDLCIIFASYLHFSIKVYFAERVTALNKDYHKLCFKCKSCNKVTSANITFNNILTCELFRHLSQENLVREMDLFIAALAITPFSVLRDMASEEVLILSSMRYKNY